MSVTRNNHYVPQWYQRGFLAGDQSRLHYLDLSPVSKRLQDGKIVRFKDRHEWPPSKCFCQVDLYTTFFGPYINDDIERMLFGKVDDSGAKAIRAFIEGDPIKCHQNFKELFLYIDAQKLRTPKGLDWIRTQYPKLDQVQLMVEMQALRAMNCTTWSEGVREIVTAKESRTKFIISDHPVTTYNPALPPEKQECQYPSDPLLKLKGTQTIFALDQEHCLILTNYEQAKNSSKPNPLETRTNARNFGNSMVRTDAFIRTRDLSENEVRKINLILKRRARQYIASANQDFLEPERYVQEDWKELQSILLPPEDKLFHFGGEMYVGYKDGSTYYQDAFGRTVPENSHLKKKRTTTKCAPNDPCYCGSGKKFKKCCKGEAIRQNHQSDEIGIRERNAIFHRGITDILGLRTGKTWLDVKRELSDEQVKRIYELYGFLWPIYTNILSLLPKPNKATRALYSGIIDPRVISESLVSAPLYFDEILVQSPFVNPGSVKPDFNPTKVPGQFKLETLRNVFLFLQLYPFIESGYITFFPDPTVFNPYLRTQAWSMAETRSESVKMTDKQRSQIEIINKDDSKRIFYMLPKNAIERQMRKSNPDLSDEQLAEMVNFIAEERSKDPLCLTQDDVFDQRGEGQLITLNLSPNLELSLVIAQATGSIIITDNLYRWEELKGAQNRMSGVVTPLVPEMITKLTSVRFPAYHDPETTWHLRNAGRLGKLRSVLCSLNSITANQDQSAARERSAWLCAELDNALIQANAELQHPKNRCGQPIEDAHLHAHSLALEVLSPAGGLGNITSQRLLVSIGNIGHREFVPMAIFFRRC